MLKTLKVKLEVSHHVQVENEWKNTKPLVFVLDDLPSETKKVTKEEKKGKKEKKKKEPALSLKTLGSALDVGKAKSATNMTLAWRCRLLGCYDCQP